MKKEKDQSRNSGGYVNPGYTCMENFRAFLKRNKIPYECITKETGYSTPHVRKVLCGAALPSPRFLRIFVYAIRKTTKENGLQDEKLDREINALVEHFSYPKAFEKYERSWKKLMKQEYPA